MSTLFSESASRVVASVARENVSALLASQMPSACQLRRLNRPEPVESASQSWASRQSILPSTTERSGIVHREASSSGLHKPRARCPKEKMKTKQINAANIAERPRGREVQGRRGCGPRQTKKSTPRQIQRRMRHIRHLLRTPRGCEPDLPRLYALQHRGQKAWHCGLGCGVARISKSIGYVADDFLRRRSKNCRAISRSECALLDAGDSMLDNTRAILIDCAHGQIANRHKAMSVNASELKTSSCSGDRSSRRQPTR